MPSKSNWLRSKVYQAIWRNVTFTVGPTVYFSLHSAAPGLTGANEIAGNAYARTALAMGVDTNGAGASSATVTFPAPAPAAWGTITHWGAWDAAVGGNFIAGDVLANPIATSIGVPVTFPTGNITWAET